MEKYFFLLNYIGLKKASVVFIIHILCISILFSIFLQKILLAEML